MDVLWDGSAQIVFGSEVDRRQAATIHRMGVGVIIVRESVGIDNA
jgi:hypothetical protein